MNLTREQIEQMPAGRDMDYALAQALGWVDLWRKGPNMGGKIPYGQFGEYGSMCMVPRYSTRLPAAFELVEALNKTHYLRLGQKWLSGGSDGGVLGYTCSFWRFKTYEGKESEAAGNTPAVSICRAALLTLLVQAYVPASEIAGAATLERKEQAQ